MQKLLDAVVLWVVNPTRDAIALTAEFYLLTKKKSIMDAMVYLTFMETTGSDRKAFEQRIAQLLPQCTTHKDFWAKVHLSVQRGIRERQLLPVFKSASKQRGRARCVGV